MFSNRSLSFSESLVVYLHELEHLSYAAIAKLVQRDERTIWTLYNRAAAKLGDAVFSYVKTDARVPLSVFFDKHLSGMEAVLESLHQQGFRNAEIARLLSRDPRTIGVQLKRVQKKRGETA